MDIRGIFSINTNENGICITQTMSDDRILLNLLIERRNREENESVKRKIKDLIEELNL